MNDKDIKSRFIKYGLVSSLTAFIDYIILISLVEFVGLYYLLAATIAFIISSMINYSITRNWCFDETRTLISHGYIKFIIVGITGIIITLSLLSIFVEVLQMKYFIARLIIYFITGGISFTLNYFFTFRMHKVKKKEYSKKR